jgi:hypothetical protein
VYDIIAKVFNTFSFTSTLPNATSLETNDPVALNGRAMMKILRVSVKRLLVAV